MVLVGGVVAYVVYQQAHPKRPGGAGDGGDGQATKGTPQLTQPEALAAVELKDQSIGHLENGPGKVEAQEGSASGLELAATGFEQLVQWLPTERLPAQNLAITRLLMMRAAETNLGPAREQARAAAKQLIDLQPDWAVAYWLAALVELELDAANPDAVTDEMRQQAVKFLDRATRLDSSNVVFWNALREAATSRDGQPTDLSRTALERAFSLSPRNIFLLTEMLMAQNAAQDAAIVETLTVARQVLEPLVEPFKRRSRLDLGDQIDKAVEGVKSGQWNAVNASVRLICNLIRPEEIAKADIARVQVHPLEFVEHEFSPEFYQAYGPFRPEWAETSVVKLTSVPDDLLAQATDVVDVKALDFTLNGLVDLLVLQPGRLRLLGRTALDQPWLELASLEVPPGMRGILAADLDLDERKSQAALAEGAAGDTSGMPFDRVLSGTATCHQADPDIVLYGEEGVLLIRNDSGKEGAETPLVIVQDSPLPTLSSVTCGALLDLEHDGDLDLAFSSAQGVSFWENAGELRFTDISRFSQLPSAQTPLTSMVPVDWDRDADIDLVVGEPSGNVTGWLMNLRHGEFMYVPFDQVYEQLRKPERLALLEADGNVSWDLLSASSTGSSLFLTATPRSGLVTFLRSETVSEQPATGVVTWDFDNDGYRDAVLWGDRGLQILRGGPKGTFAAAQPLQGEVPGSIRAVACRDLDRDGDQDLVVAASSGIQLWINDGSSGNQWLTLYPMGQSDNKGRCNHDAIGSLVELRAGGWYQAQVIDAPIVHFGLGDQQKVQQLRIVWTNGVPQDIVDLSGSVAICEPMLLKGSCPFVYTMVGGEFSFLTDCLWAAPIGLQTAQGTLAPTRSWEYLLVPGERLTPQDGSYWIMMTEELWEAGYFDQVQLIAVDHPADVEVYSNEKVGPPDIASFKIHTVSRRRTPIRAADSSGRDVQQKLQSRDGDFVKPFDERIRQGLAPEHYVELDLGPLGNPREILLYLTGWIYPTDTSLNVAFFQNPEVDGPRMPSVWVPDADGQWKETVAYMGFPGGKTKTIVVDLSRAFLTEDYRVRIKTTAEIYWDEAFFTVNEPQVELRQTALELQSAELNYRGFSRELPRSDEAPQMYDASHVRRAAAWPPMRGKFTRYGNVTALLAGSDDMMAVIGAGDAITIRFAVPEQPVPEGWRRDFLLHSVGWDKDADLNTVYGQSSDPLPFREMKSYPFGIDDAPPDSAEYRDYLRRYQTREQDTQLFWRRLKLDAATP